MGEARAILERISKSQNFDGYRQEHWHGTFDEYLETDRRRGCDLRVLPLMRMALFRVADDRHRFVLTYHHIIADAWSMSLQFHSALKVVIDSGARGSNLAGSSPDASGERNQ